MNMRPNVASLVSLVSLASLAGCFANASDELASDPVEADAFGSEMGLTGGTRTAELRGVGGTNEPLAARSALRGQACGGRGFDACPSGQACIWSLGARCGSSDLPGRCEVVPSVCQRDYRPVCGCDGVTYPNACSARAAGASLASDKACSKP